MCTSLFMCLWCNTWYLSAVGSFCENMYSAHTWAHFKVLPLLEKYVFTCRSDPIWTSFYCMDCGWVWTSNRVPLWNVLSLFSILFRDWLCMTFLLYCLMDHFEIMRLPFSLLFGSLFARSYLLMILRPFWFILTPFLSIRTPFYSTGWSLRVPIVAQFCFSFWL